MNMNEEPSSESTNLLPHVGDKNQCSQQGVSTFIIIKVMQCHSDLCISSRAAIISAAVVGCLYYLVMDAAIALLDNPASYTNSLSVNYSLPYAILVYFVMIFYPLTKVDLSLMFAIND